VVDGRGYDTAVDTPSADEVRRAGKALALGAALGLVMVLFARSAPRAR
jgi:hypothetical protein